MQILEAVPNISEGKRPEIIRQIVHATSIQGARLLHFDSNADANRTVFTLAGKPQSVIQSVFALFRVASELIDMKNHHGEHPRLGAIDVCPLVPVREISLSEVAVLADNLARRVAQELHIPVYLYEENARTNDRKNLAFIRQGEYENLAQKLFTLPPDYGPQVWSEHLAKTGATVIGARKYLIAFNMSLSTKETQIARDIATQLREKNGGLKCVKAIGWYMPHYHCAQVSCNLTDFTQTNLAKLFEMCKKLATARGVQITAGELIGLIPQKALVEAGKFYFPNEKNTATLIDVAIQHLLLNKLHPFHADKRILENRLEW